MPRTLVHRSVLRASSHIRRRERMSALIQPGDGRCPRLRGLQRRVRRPSDPGRGRQLPQTNTLVLIRREDVLGLGLLPADLSPHGIPGEEDADHGRRSSGAGPAPVTAAAAFESPRADRSSDRFATMIRRTPAAIRPSRQPMPVAGTGCSRPATTSARTCHASAASSARNHEVGKGLGQEERPRKPVRRAAPTPVPVRTARPLPYRWALTRMLCPP